MATTVPGNSCRKRSSQATELEAASQKTEELVRRLEGLLAERQELLELLGSARGGSCQSLQSAVAPLPEDLRRPLLERMERLGAVAGQVRHHAAANWMVSRRAHAFVTELLDVIATGGQGRPTYGGSVENGGTFVDSTA